MPTLVSTRRRRVWPILEPLLAAALVFALTLAVRYPENPLVLRAASTTDEVIRAVPEGLLYIPNCATAQTVGLAPIRRGQPGYAPHLDRNNDGIACVPWPR